MKTLLKLLLTLLILTMTSCSEAPLPEKPKLLIYCGVTMVKPITELAKTFEEEHSVTIQITQGGSQDLYDSLKFSQQGDIYFPGSASYRKNNEAEGFLKEHTLVGYNRLAIFVEKGNPKQLNNDLHKLTRKDLKTILCDPKAGSVGRYSEKVLKKIGIAEQAYENAVFLTPDSRRIIEAFKNKQADLALNWYATGFWPGNQDLVDVIEIDDKLANPKALELNRLSFSKHPELAKSFIEYAASPEGRQVFREYGFLTESEHQALVESTD